MIIRQLGLVNSNQIIFMSLSALSVNTGNLTTMPNVLSSNWVIIPGSEYFKFMVGSRFQLCFFDFTHSTFRLSALQKLMA